VLVAAMLGRPNTEAAEKPILLSQQLFLERIAGRFRVMEAVGYGTPVSCGVPFGPRASEANWVAVVELRFQRLCDCGPELRTSRALELGQPLKLAGEQVVENRLGFLQGANTRLEG